MTRAPAVPLIVHDPFFSIWSAGDRLAEVWPTHWTGRNQSLCGLIRIDGVTYRFMGRAERSGPAIPAMEQTDLTITATRSTYRFTAAGVALEVAFLSPSLPHDLDVMARPLTYVDIALDVTDGKQHQVQAYVDMSAVVSVDRIEQRVVWGRHRWSGAQSLWMGSVDQPLLGRGGDEVFIDWGYVHLSPSPGREAVGAIGEALTLRRAFARSGSIPERDGARDGSPLAMPAPASGGEAIDPDGTRHDRAPLVVGAWVTDFGEVSGQAAWSVAAAYDHVRALEYFGERLRPYWHRTHPSAISMIAAAWSDHDDLVERCAAFDADLARDLARVGDATFVRLATLAFRQCIGAHMLAAERDGTLLYFSKENSSNGCMGTVDLTYPSSPFFLLLSPALLEAQVRPLLDYAASAAWPWPYAPHDIGRFPLANGQVYGGGEHTEDNQMPFEECGNMLILVGALAHLCDRAQVFAKDWPLLRSWAEYLIDQGYDPGQQLCTDDFDGPMAHNVNLSAKAIVALGAAATLAAALDDAESAARYQATARAWAEAWVAARDGGTSRWCFDRAESWSLKYNLIWDRVLGLGLFGDDVVRDEIARYRAEASSFGVPLHSGARHTKLDWLVWAASLADDREDRDALLAPLGAWLDAAPDRVPLSDWFDVDTGKLTRPNGFRARSVVGGVFMPMLADPKMRQARGLKL